MKLPHAGGQALPLIARQGRPILPRSSELLLETLGYAGDDVRVDAPWVAGVAGARVTEPAAAFPRKEEKPV